MNVQLLLDRYPFFTGVPDSQLKALCSALINARGIGHDHIIAANEGNCTALAAGYYLATGKVPVVYLQNSGIGNIINPVASLLSDRVYAIPCLFIVGWRGEPGVHDEPQHVFQGEVTEKLLQDMELDPFILSKDTTEAEVVDQLNHWEDRFRQGKSASIIVRKGALSHEGKVSYSNDNLLMREDIIRAITRFSGRDIIVSTTGKTSRELFEIREAAGQSHETDLLTVGSMGHASSIAMGIALQKPATRVWCIDGDGAALMHMGAMAIIGTNKPRNLIHIIINNGAHESVGGMPTVAGQIDIPGIAAACGYPCIAHASTMDELTQALQMAIRSDSLCLIEVSARIGSRDDLGRPTTTARENRDAFMAYLKTCK